MPRTRISGAGLHGVPSPFRLAQRTNNSAGYVQEPHLIHHLPQATRHGPNREGSLQQDRFLWAPSATSSAESNWD
ncbi:hypothetical protein PtB15_3B546 [Puccinia triticina]|nr:hypothetical protein PtB15_3B546 [Puccinia triticina]